MTSKFLHPKPTNPIYKIEMSPMIRASYQLSLLEERNSILGKKNAGAIRIVEYNSCPTTSMSERAIEGKAPLSGLHEKDFLARFQRGPELTNLTRLDFVAS